MTKGAYVELGRSNQRRHGRETHIIDMREFG